MIATSAIKKPDHLTTFTRLGISVLIMGLGLYVALSPGVVYAPVPKVVLFCLISFLPAVLLGAEATSQLKVGLGWFVFSTGGAAAVALGTLVLLSHLAKPEQQIAVYRIVDESREPVLGLDRDGAVDVLLSQRAITVTRFIDGNNIILIFPEQVPEVDLIVRPTSSGPGYIGKVGYTGSRQSELMLGRDLKAN